MDEQKDYIGHRQRIKERFLRGQGKDMADYEFLELLLTFAIPRKDTKPLAKALINEFGSFAAVIGADDNMLMSFSGLKENTVMLFSIIREAALRMTWQNLCASDKPVISNWDAMVDFCRMKLAHKKREEFMLILLDAKLQVIGEEVQQRGTVDNVAIHPAEVVKSAVFNSAKSVNMVHNHPSGNVTPSKADILITKQINTALQSVNIKLQDHLIIGKNECFSFRSEGLI